MSMVDRHGSGSGSRENSGKNEVEMISIHAVQSIVSLFSHEY